MTHQFTATILAILEDSFPGIGKTVFDLSPLLQYINHKTKSANRGSKSRSSFNNLYALYVLIEDYRSGDFHNSGTYPGYKGANFSPLLSRIRKMPFGQGFQNHSLNSRVNDEFHKYFPDEDRRPILRNVADKKYWINESLLKVNIGDTSYNLSQSIIHVIDQYISTKRESFAQFIRDCESLRDLPQQQTAVVEFVQSLIAPEKDARLFEIASYSILKAHFATEIVFIGSTRELVEESSLQLFKTGRTNANDGGIDFVMRPVGRFFQVTETLDVKKYFLDIDKIERFPISFVVKTSLGIEEIQERLRKGAEDQYGVADVVEKYMAAIEEVFNTPKLLEILNHLVADNQIDSVLEEIIKWSKVEFNYVEGDSDPGSVTDEDEDE